MVRLGNLRRAIDNHSAGFTLIETLIATLILSAVIYLATLSYSIFLDVWGQKRLSDTRAIDAYRSHILVRSALESIYDYYVTDPANEKNGLHYPYFKGGRDTLEFVTLSSVFKKGLPAAARIKLKNPDTGNENYRTVIYEESLLDKAYIKYSGDNLKYSRLMTVYTGVKNLNIRYYGVWETKWSPEKDDFETIYKWQKTFDGKKKKAVPELIEITLITDDGDKTLLFPVRGNNVYKRAFFNPVL